MGSQGEGSSIVRKPRFLCLHGFRTSGEIMKKQLNKWPKSVIDRLDLVFLDAPFPCQGKSDYDGIFDPPYYEWFQYNKEYTVYTNLEKCLEFLEDRMIKLGPFDGLIGFSQGAILSGALLGMQAKGIAFQKMPKIKFVIIIGGAMFKSTKMIENAYSSTLDTLSLHFVGETDFVKHSGTKLTKLFKYPVVVNHPKGHTVPRLDDKTLEKVTGFIETIEQHMVMEAVKKNGEEIKTTSIRRIMGNLTHLTPACVSNGYSIIVIRGLSDLAGVGDNTVRKFGSVAATHTAKAVLEFIKMFPPSRDTSPYV